MAVELDIVDGDPYHPRLGVGYLLAPILGQELDAWTTYIALRRGFVEFNPAMKALTGNPILWHLFKLGTGIGLAALANKQFTYGNPRAAKILSLVSGALGVVPGLMNIKTMRGA
jgi:hypothetical protein